MAENITGTCNCGAIKISLPKSSYPDSSVFCHCLSCRASSGGLMSVNLVISSKDVKVQGTPKKYSDSDTTSGNTVERNFCGDCGSPIMSIVQQAPDTAFVKAGLFAKAGVELPAPGIEIYWNRREKWECPAKGAKIME